MSVFPNNGYAQAAVKARLYNYLTVVKPLAVTLAAVNLYADSLIQPGMYPDPTQLTAPPPDHILPYAAKAIEIIGVANIFINTVGGDSIEPAWSDQPEVEVEALITGFFYSSHPERVEAWAVRYLWAIEAILLPRESCGWPSATGGNIDRFNIFSGGRPSRDIQLFTGSPYSSRIDLRLPGIRVQEWST